MRHVFSFLQATLLACGLFMAIAQGACAADGGISLGRTRIIVEPGDKAQTMTIRNQGDRPYLVQSAVVTSPEGREFAPFITTPPLFRLEANSQSAIRILPKNNLAMPTDRESVFYFTAMAIPATDKLSGENDPNIAARLSVGIQNTIKLFYRPAGLGITVEEAEGKLRFQLKNGKVQVENPTPYYLTLSKLAFDGAEINIRDSVSMIAPFSQATYSVKGKVSKAQWALINDYGGTSKTYQSTLQREGK